MSDIFSAADAFSSPSSKQSDVTMRWRHKGPKQHYHTVSLTGVGAVSLTQYEAALTHKRKCSNSIKNSVHMALWARHKIPKQTSRASDFLSQNLLVPCLAFLLSVVNHKTTSAPTVALYWKGCGLTAKTFQVLSQLSERCSCQHDLGVVKLNLNKGMMLKYTVP